MVDDELQLAASDDPRSTVYTATQGDRVDVGWDTLAIDPGQIYGDAVDLHLRAVDGPDGLAEQTERLPAGEDGELSWRFTDPGRYTVAVAAEASLITGEPLNAEEHYVVEVRSAPADSPQQAPAASPAPKAGADPKPARAAQAEPRTRQRARTKARAPQQTPTTPGKILLDEGHVDAVAPRLLNGKLQIQVKDGVTVGQSGGRVHWREPRDVVFHAKPRAKAKLPDDKKLSFLGKPGDSVFLLPQQQQPDILWTGWSTEELRAQQVSGSVTWRLTAVDGPGAFGIFTTGSFGDSSVVFNSVDGLPDTHSVPLGTHAHANWGFAKQGVYKLTFEVTAKLSGGGTARDTETYTFAVGDVDPGNLPRAGGGGETPDGTPGVGGSGGNEPLPTTGPSAVLGLTAGGVVLLGLGGSALFVSRKRRNPTS